MLAQSVQGSGPGRPPVGRREPALELSQWGPELRTVQREPRSRGRGRLAPKLMAPELAQEERRPAVTGLPVSRPALPLEPLRAASERSTLSDPGLSNPSLSDQHLSSQGSSPKSKTTKTRKHLHRHVVKKRGARPSSR